jgi:arylsulfatase A-like enzyme
LAKGIVEVSDEDVRFWRAWYDEKINAADARFGIFINGLKELGLWDNSIIIVASDHGTEFYEHKRFDHGHTLYQELIHVPLLVHLPSSAGGKTVGDLVSTLDIMPTVLDLIGIQADAALESQMKGISLVPALRGKSASREVYVETDYRLFTHKRGILTPEGWKFIFTFAEAPDKQNVRELYNLNADPKELTNLIEREPRLAYELEQKLLNHLKNIGTNPDGPWVVGCSAVYNEQCK